MLGCPVSHSWLCQWFQPELWRTVSSPPCFSASGPSPMPRSAGESSPQGQLSTHGGLEQWPWILVTDWIWRLRGTEECRVDARLLRSGRLGQSQGRYCQDRGHRWNIKWGWVTSWQDHSLYVFVFPRFRIVPESRCSQNVNWSSKPISSCASAFGESCCVGMAFFRNSGATTQSPSNYPGDIDRSFSFNTCPIVTQNISIRFIKLLFPCHLSSHFGSHLLLGGLIF